MADKLEFRRDLRHATRMRMKRMRMLYLFLLFPAVILILFSYKPMYGVIISFKDYKYVRGITGSDWNHFKHYIRLWKDGMFWRSFWNTLRISLKSMLFNFPAPIIFALLLNELRSPKFKRVIQTISYLPHFLSAIIVTGFVKQILSVDYGILNYVRELLGMESVFFLGEKNYFDTILIGMNLWQGIGWGSVLYLATLSNVNPELYEAAALDGANRLQKMWHVTVPALVPIIVIQMILSMRGILNVGFDGVFNLYNAKTMPVADVISTYTYRVGLQSNKFDYSTAIGLGQSVVGLIIVLIVNSIARRISDYSIW